MHGISKLKLPLTLKVVYGLDLSATLGIESGAPSYC